MSSFSLASLPSLPLEVKGHVLRFCDPSTLAVTSRVSLAFLELSIPILHDHIIITGLDNMEKLLCSRASSAPSALDSILSLRHVRAFSLISADVDDEDLSYSVPLDRLANGISLPVSRLTIDLGDERDSCWDHVLHVFDPESVRIHAAHPNSNNHATVDIDSLAWHRLRSIEFSGCTAYNYLAATVFFQRKLGAVEDVPLNVTYDLVKHGASSAIWYWVMEDLVECQQRELDMFGPTSRLAEVVMRVSTEAARATAMSSMMDWFEDMSEPERTRRLALIKVEVADATGVPEATST